MTAVPEVDAEVWDVIASADPHASAFQGAAWLRTWAEHRAPDGAHFRTFGDWGAVADVPSGDAARSLAGGRDVTDYRGPIAREGRQHDLASAWLDELGSEGIARLDLHGIPSDTGWLDVMDEVGGPLGWSLDERGPEDVCPVVDLEGDDPEAWLERLDGRERHELRRKGRKLARDLGGLALVEVAADDLEAALDRFWEMAVTAEADKGEFFRDDAMRTFFGAAVERLGADRTLRIHELVVGGLPAASMISVVWDGWWGLYNSAFDAALGAFAPGTVLAAELATHAASEGFGRLDFLRGDEEYKYRFGAVDRPIESAVLVRTAT